MNVVDSSGWIEYLAGRRNEPFFRAVIEDPANLLVPSICIHEVVRYLTRAVDRRGAEEAAAQMKRAKVVPLDANLAVLSARLGLRHSLALADSIIYATAQAQEAKLFTQDADLAKLPGVKYIRAS